MAQQSNYATGGPAAAAASASSAAAAKVCELLSVQKSATAGNYHHLFLERSIMLSLWNCASKG